MLETDNDIDAQQSSGARSPGPATAVDATRPLDEKRRPADAGTPTGADPASDAAEPARTPVTADPSRLPGDERQARPPLVATPGLSSLEQVALSIGAFVTFDQPQANAAVGSLFSIHGWMIRHPHAPEVQFDVNGVPVRHLHRFRRDDAIADHPSYPTTGFEFWVDVSQVRDGTSAALVVTARCGEVVVQQILLRHRDRHLLPRRDELVYFMHMPKTAGSAVARAIDSHRDVLPTLKVYAEMGCLPPAQLGEISDEALASFDLVYGHFNHGLHSRRERPFTYCTILRDPYDFVISQYFFAKHVRKAPECIDSFSIHEFLRHHPFAFENSYCRALCGDLPEDTPVRESDFRRAQQVIEAGFFFVGLTERLQESLQRIGRRLGVDISRHNDRVNVTPDSLERDNLDLPAFRRTHHDLVRFDLQLYDWVHKRFFAYR